MAFNKTVPSIQNGEEKGRETPAVQEKADPMTEFIGSLQPGNQEDVLAIIGIENLSIDKRLEFLEDYLTVGQLKTCRSLLEEQCSNFKKFLSIKQINLVDRMITKGDLASIKKLVTATGNPAALEAFQNYLKYKGLEETGERKEKQNGGAKKRLEQPNKGALKCQSDSCSSEEEEDGEDRCSSENAKKRVHWKTPHQDEHKICRSGQRNNHREALAQPLLAITYEPFVESLMKVAENWKKSSEIGLKTVEQLAEIIAKENAGKMAELEEKLKRLERENERLKEQLKETEESHKEKLEAMARDYEQRKEEDSDCS